MAMAPGPAFEALAAEIATTGAAVTVIDAVAGAGKTAMLAEIARASAPTSVLCEPEGPGLLLLDLPTGLKKWDGLARVLAWAEAGGRRAVIAKRPTTSVPGLERAVLSGNARIFDERRLFAAILSDGAPVGTGGWPILLGPAATGPDAGPLLHGYVAAELFVDIHPATLTLVEAITSSPEGRRFDLAEDVEDLLPVRGLVARDTQTGRWRCIAEAARPVLNAVATQLLARWETPEELGRRAALLRRIGDPVRAIQLMLSAGEPARASEWFEAEGGYNFIYHWGAAAYDAVLNAFEAAGIVSDEIVMARALRALKNGQLDGARQALLAHFGPDSLTLAKVYAARTPFSAQYRVFRAILAIYDSISVPDEIIERMFDTLEQLNERDFMHRGNLLNALLEIYVRRRRLPEAESMAARALDNYRRADAPMLCFYVALFLAMMSIMRGDMAAAGHNATMARRFLDETGFDSQPDRRLLSLVEATIEYEQGDAARLAQFLTREFDSFADGEIWPSLVEFTIEHGSLSLLEHGSVFAALDFLDRWRIHRWPARSLRLSIEIAAATVLQKANRWLQASGTLTPLQSRVSRVWTETVVDELPLIADHAEINLIMAWMRTLIHDVPQRPLIRRQINLLMGNHHVTARQRLTLSVWAAYVGRRQNDLTATRVTLLDAFEAAARLSCLAPLREEAVFLGELLADRRVSSFLRTSSIARQVISRLEAADRGSAPEMMGLTRREARILMMVAEGGSNKYLARALEVSEVTVKFHLSNIYRKLDCKGRAQAIATARSLGWIR